MCVDLSPLRFSRIHFRPVPELKSAQVLSDCTNTVLYVIAVYLQARTVIPNSPQSDMNVRVLRVEMCHGCPLEPSVQILLHASHELACQLLQIQAISELRRNDELEQALIASLLPNAEGDGEVAEFLVARECRRCAAAASRALAHDVPAVSAPLARCFVARVDYAHGTAPVNRFRGLVLPDAPRRFFRDMRA